MNPAMNLAMNLALIIKFWQRTGQRGDALAALPPEERQALARDLGLSDDVLVRVAALGPAAGAELPRLLQALGLDEAEIRRRDGALMRDMSVVCTQCQAAETCRHDLENGQAASDFMQYCPNAEPLDALIGQAGAHRPTA